MALFRKRPEDAQGRIPVPVGVCPCNDAGTEPPHTLPKLTGLYLTTDGTRGVQIFPRHNCDQLRIFGEICYRTQ